MTGSIDLIKTLPAKAMESQRIVFCHLFKLKYIIVSTYVCLTEVSFSYKLVNVVDCLTRDNLVLVYYIYISRSAMMRSLISDRKWSYARDRDTNRLYTPTTGRSLYGLVINVVNKNRQVLSSMPL